jgi:hypothetical protein
MEILMGAPTKWGARSLGRSAVNLMEAILGAPSGHADATTKVYAPRVLGPPRSGGRAAWGGAPLI